MGTVYERVTKEKLCDTTTVTNKLSEKLRHLERRALHINIWLTYVFCWFVYLRAMLPCTREQNIYLCS